MGSFFSRDNQAQARAELEERINFAPLIKDIGKQTGLGAVFGLLQNLISNNHQRSFEPHDVRDFSEEERRAFLSGAIPSLLGSLKNDKSLLQNIAGGVASAVGSTAIGSMLSGNNNNNNNNNNHR